MLLLKAKQSTDNALKTLSQLLILMRFDKPIGIFLLLWPTLWGLWFAAQGIPSPKILIVFILGVILMRAAGCIINDIVDRDLDPQVTRTRLRPLAAKTVSLPAAMISCGLLLAAAFSLVCFLNPLTIALSLIAAILALVYPLMKRLTHWPQIVLGAAFSWSIPMAFAAIDQHIPGLAWGLFAISVLWAVSYDTEYAMTDRADDLKAGIKSTAVLFGDYSPLVIGLLQLIIMAALVVIGYQQQLLWPYYLSLAVATVLAYDQHRLLKQSDPHTYLQAFIRNNWFGGTIFLGIALSYLLKDHFLR